MFKKADDEGYISKVKGVRQKTLVYGEKTLLTEFRLERGNILPKHTHPHEQTGYLIRGHIVLHISGEKYDVLPGDSWCVPGGAEHQADIIEDSVAVEVFSPVREDYLPQVP